MNEYTTLLKKSCGHHGMIRSKFPQSTISCSQCAINEKDLDMVYVQVLTRKFMLSKDVPKLNFEAMESWIKRKLED